MAQTAVQKASVAATVAKVKAANQAKNTAPVTVATIPVAQPVNPIPTTPVQTQGSVPSTPVQPTAVTQWATPTPVAPTSTTPTTVASPSQPDFQDNSDKRFKEIQVNLEKAAKTNPNMFTDRSVFDTSFSYRDRSNQQKAILDSFFLSKQSWVDAWVQQAKQQKQANDMMNTLNLLTPEEMVGRGLSDEQKTILSQTNPEKFAQYQKKYEEKIALDIINWEASKNKNPFEDKVNEILNKVIEVPNLKEEFKSQLDALKPKQEELNGAKDELTQIEDEMDGILQDTRKELEWSWATDSYIRALASKRMEEITPVYKAKARAYNTLLDSYKTDLSNMDQQLSLAKDQYTMNQQAQSQQMNSLWFAMNLMSYQTPKQKEDSAWNSFLKQQDYMNGDINSKDPKIKQRAIDLAVDWVLKEFSGIAIKRSREQVIKDVTNLLNSGKDLGTAITENLRKPIMDKPEYQLWKNNKLGISNTPVNIGWSDYTQNEDWSFTPFVPPFSYDWFKWDTTKSPMRTDRNNNPTAMTTDVAKTLWLVEWVDYVKWDVFPNNSNLFSAKLIGDPIQQTIKALDTAIANWKRAFYTQWGQQRWTHTGMSNEQWQGMNNEQKVATVVKMYHNEWGNWSLIAWIQGSTTWGNATAAELAMFAKWAQYIWEKGWLSAQRYNEIAAQQKANTPTQNATNDPVTLQSVTLPTTAKEPQVKSKTYADRMNFAVNWLIDVEKEFAGRTTAWQYYQENTFNARKSDNQQFLESAKQNFITASLRQESWASISPVEFAKEEKKYFPQPWDSIATVKSKQKAREFAIQSMYWQAGADENWVNIWNLYKQRDIDTIWGGTDTSRASWLKDYSVGSTNNTINGVDLSAYIQ